MTFSQSRRRIPRSLTCSSSTTSRSFGGHWLKCSSQRGHIVTEAGDAKETLRVVTRAANRPDVILLDYRLPDSNDLSLFAAIKRELPEIPIILMTAYGSPEITAGALALGAYRVVNKPFEVQDLVTLVLEAHDPCAGP